MARALDEIALRVVARRLGQALAMRQGNDLVLRRVDDEHRKVEVFQLFQVFVAVLHQQARGKERIGLLRHFGEGRKGALEHQAANRIFLGQGESHSRPQGLAVEDHALRANPVILNERLDQRPAVLDQAGFAGRAGIAPIAPVFGEGEPQSFGQQGAELWPAKRRIAGVAVEDDDHRRRRVAGRQEEVLERQSVGGLGGDERAQRRAHARVVAQLALRQIDEIALEQVERRANSEIDECDAGDDVEHAFVPSAPQKAAGAGSEQ